MNGPITFGIVGGAWRAQFFFRIAQTLPERFQIAGCMTRTQASRVRIEEKWGIPTFGSIGELAELKPAFVVTSVPWPLRRRSFWSLRRMT